MGTTRRKALEAARAQLKRRKTKQQLDQMFAELEPVDVDPQVAHLISTFNQLSMRRQSGMAGPQLIPFSEIDAYCRLMDEQLSPWEIGTLGVMDRVFVDKTYELMHLDKSERQRSPE